MFGGVRAVVLLSWVCLLLYNVLDLCDVSFGFSGFLACYCIEVDERVWGGWEKGVFSLFRVLDFAVWVCGARIFGVLCHRVCRGL